MVWKPVLGYEGLYEVSDQGNVRSLERIYWRRGRPVRLEGNELKPWPRSRGWYLTVTLCRRGKNRKHYVHALVLEAFVGPRPDGHDALHYNGVMTDNRLENLRWGTAKENREDDRRLGNVQLGSAVPSAKLSEEAVLEIRKRSLVGESRLSLASKFGVSRSLISMIVHRRRWAHL